MHRATVETSRAADTTDRRLARIEQPSVFVFVQSRSSGWLASLTGGDGGN